LIIFLTTIEAHHAKRFLQIMHDELPDYGVSINPDKMLVNFEVLVNGQKLPRLVDNRCFPYYSVRN
jgi:telomerase reverse transcriptase